MAGIVKGRPLLRPRHRDLAKIAAAPVQRGQPTNPTYNQVDGPAQPRFSEVRIHVCVMDVEAGLALGASGSRAVNHQDTSFLTTMLRQFCRWERNLAGRRVPVTPHRRAWLLGRQRAVPRVCELGYVAAGHGTYSASVAITQTLTIRGSAANPRRVVRCGTHRTAANTPRMRSPVRIARRCPAGA